MPQHHLLLFLHTALVFHSRETADNLKMCVHRHRPVNTTRYIDKILSSALAARGVHPFVCLLSEFLT